jgi:GxxExxY protein
MIEHEDTKVTKHTKERGLVVSHEVIGAAIEAHRHLGPGLFESAYAAALCQELWIRRLGFERQVPIRMVYKGQLRAAA